MAEAMDELAATVSRLQTLISTENNYQGIGKARGIPAEFRRAADLVEITPFRSGGYSSREASPVEVSAAKDIKEAYAAVYADNGELAKHAALLEIAAEINALRAVLPGLAAKAAVEIGITARETEAEAWRDLPDHLIEYEGDQN